MAGGKGTRFKTSTPKQFLALEGKPVLLHTIEAFYKYSDQIAIVLVLPEGDLNTWQAIVDKFDFKGDLIVQHGGMTRFQSVRNGLEKIGDGWVAIHDGVRPLVTPQTIATSFRLAKVHDCAIASVPLKESLRTVPLATLPADEIAGSLSADRSRFRIVQTPQTFRASLIKEAYTTVPEDPALTDDASVAEKAGLSVVLFDGSYENIKITTPEDLAMAATILSGRSL